MYLSIFKENIFFLQKVMSETVQFIKIRLRYNQELHFQKQVRKYHITGRLQILSASKISSILVVILADLGFNLC